MKRLALSYVINILESSYRKQVSPLSFKTWLNWNQLKPLVVFKAVHSTFTSARVLVLCEWDEIGYFK